MRRAVLTAATVILLAATATACGDDDDDRPQSERDYLSHVYDAAEKEGSGIRGYRGDKVVDLGHQVCKNLDKGVAPSDIVASIKANDESDFHAVSAVASDIVGNAQIYLCPK